MQYATARFLCATLLFVGACNGQDEHADRASPQASNHCDYLGLCSKRCFMLLRLYATDRSEVFIWLVHFSPEGASARVRR